jgi:hypothetical protein
MRDFPSADSIKGVTAPYLKDSLKGRDKPLIFKGAVSDWPIVTATRQGMPALIEYLKTRDNGRPVETFRQAPDGDGKYFYDGELSGFNFARAAIPLPAVLDRLARPDAEPIYIQSAKLLDHLPRVKAENSLPGIAAEPRIWIGNRSKTQIHFDLYDNLACMVAGKKRFVLFPPEQVGNLYMGPFETTVSGVPTAMADLENPDFDRHPRFAEALKYATVADLQPGDVLYIPYMWWHHVVSDGAFNAQINFWWDDSRAGLGQPIHALFHAMLALRDLPEHYRAAWKPMFDHFVFSGVTGQHLPEAARGLQGELTDEQRAAIRKQLGRNLLED